MSIGKISLQLLKVNFNLKLKLDLVLEIWPLSVTVTVSLGLAYLSKFKSNPNRRTGTPILANEIIGKVASMTTMAFIFLLHETDMVMVKTYGIVLVINKLIITSYVQLTTDGFSLSCDRYFEYPSPVT